MDSEPSPRLYRSVRLLIVTLIKLHYILERNNMFQLSLSVCLRLAQWMWHSRRREACGWWTTTTGVTILVATSSTPRWDPICFRFLTVRLTIQTQVRAGACLSLDRSAMVFSRRRFRENSSCSRKVRGNAWCTTRMLALMVVCERKLFHSWVCSKHCKYRVNGGAADRYNLSLNMKCWQPLVLIQHPTRLDSPLGSSRLHCGCPSVIKYHSFEYGDKALSTCMTVISNAVGRRTGPRLLLLHWKHACRCRTIYVWC